MARSVVLALFCLGLAACDTRVERTLGTLEWDRIALPAPAAERIVEIRVREGERVEKGQLLMALDPEQTLAQLRAAEAAVTRQAAALEELQVGPRIEEIERAKADVAAAVAVEADRTAEYRRLRALGAKNYASRSDIDAARAAAESASAQVRASREQLLELQRGSRSEDVAQGQALLAQAESEAAAQRVLLEKLTLRAPQTGLIDSIPFKLGDQAPVGASLVVMLTGDTPYARVYVPQPLRLNVQLGVLARVHLTGDEKGAEHGTDETRAGWAREYIGRVRMVRNVPSFTPYYALTGEDVTRLSYIAEIQMGADAAQLPAGLPVTAEFVAGAVVSEDPAREDQKFERGEQRPNLPQHEPYDGGK
ncbi:HlyD family secretion protein [uncultured Microbulbifer sp.]|uniref:HlyD family secretion protein n=1 Tax=uncultured Microbulbifer sp. TaxID=348147 RepID=UPI0026326449|nr:biotin/lipoyl-binding protein [uncultured Microbulbifer sp.]